MKTFVVEADVDELDIKPHGRFHEYRALVEHDVAERLLAPGTLRPAPCPGCGRSECRPAFEKLGLAYVECVACGTVYVSPRPSEAAVVAFFRETPSARFWRERIGGETRELRRDKIFRPRAEWVLDVIDRHRPQATRTLVAGYHSELLVDELVRQLKRPMQLVVTNPIADIERENATPASADMRPTDVAQLGQLGPADLVLAFDLIDRTVDLDGFVAGARAALAPGGLILVSTALITGFDFLVLWDRSESIIPPERLNLLSAEGVLALAARHGFEVLEFSTPGVFDVETVARFVAAHPDAPVPRFVRYLLERRDETARAAFQDFLQQQRLSSFARITLIKR